MNDSNDILCFKLWNYYNILIKKSTLSQPGNMCCCISSSPAEWSQSSQRWTFSCALNELTLLRDNTPGHPAPDHLTWWSAPDTEAVWGPGSPKDDREWGPSSPKDRDLAALRTGTWQPKGGQRMGTWQPRGQGPDSPKEDGDLAALKRMGIWQP